MLEKLNFRRRIIDKAIENALTFDDKLRLHEAMKYLPLAGGKRLRPIIAMLSCEAVGGNSKKIIPFCVALELIHNFTLVHDDIMDKDGLRRGMKTTHVVFSEPTTIIAGDALFARAFEILAELDVNGVVLKKIFLDFSSAIRVMAEGQDMDIDFEERTDVSEEEYLKMVEKKTARIIKTAAMGGAMIGNGSAEQVKNLAEYGRLIGIGFQIWDDVLGLVGDPKRTGKPVGNDLRRGKKTLIVICGLNKAKGADRKFLCSVLGNENASEKEIRNAVEILEKTNSIGYARDMAIAYAERAKYNLKYLQKSESREILEMLADYSVGRDK